MIPSDTSNDGSNYNYQDYSDSSSDDSSSDDSSDSQVETTTG